MTNQDKLNAVLVAVSNVETGFDLDKSIEELLTAWRVYREREGMNKEEVGKFAAYLDLLSDKVVEVNVHWLKEPPDDARKYGIGQQVDEKEYVKWVLEHRGLIDYIDIIEIKAPADESH